MPRRQNTNSRGTALLAKRATNELIAALRSQGIPLRLLRDVCDQALQAARQPVVLHQVPIAKDSALLGSAIASWSRNPRYVDKHGEPKPLPCYGARPSIEALLRECGLRQGAKSAARRLIATGAVQKTKGGRYLPKDRSVRITAVNEYLAEHVAHGVLRMVQTAFSNFSPSGRRRPLLQRAAAVRTLPKSLRSDFQAFVNTQGNAFVTSVDDWLEARSVPIQKAGKSPPKKYARAGLYAFAYFDV